MISVVTQTSNTMEIVTFVIAGVVLAIVTGIGKYIMTKGKERSVRIEQTLETVKDLQSALVTPKATALNPRPQMGLIDAVGHLSEVVGVLGTQLTKIQLNTTKLVTDMKPESADSSRAVLDAVKESIDTLTDNGKV